MIFLTCAVTFFLILMWLDRNEWRRMAHKWKQVAEHRQGALIELQNRIFKGKHKDV